MHNICTAIFTFASICLAKVPLNKANSSASDVLPLGFPPGDLPMEASSDMAGNLLLPLDPSQPTNLKQNFKFEKGPTVPLKGSHLIYSISLIILGSWENNRNAPIKERQDIRLQPYTDIWHTIRPALSAEVSEVGALTPLRVGIVYCWMMRELLSQPTWPGLVTAYVYYADQALRPKILLGEIGIKNKPQTNAASVLIPPKNRTGLEASVAPQGNISFITSSDNNNNVEVPVLRDVASREKAWLSCFIQLLFKILKYPPSARINEHYPVSTGGFLWTVRSAVDPKQMGYVKFAPLTLDLTWYKLARTVLSVCEKATRNNRWQNEESATIFQGGIIFIAEIRFKRV